MWSVRVLSILALASVLSLLATSDFSAPFVTSASQIVPGSQNVRMICIFESAKQGPNGWTVVLRDSQDQPIRGYIAKGVLAAMPTPGSLVEVAADLSWENGLFFFIKEVSPVRV